MTATLTASPLFQTSVDHLDLQLPPDCDYLRSNLPDQVLSVDWDKDSRVVHIKLADKLTGPVTVPVKARYTKPVVGLGGPARSPCRCRGRWTPRDGGGRIDVTVPDEVELHAAGRGTGDKRGPQTRLAVRQGSRKKWSCPGSRTSRTRTPPRSST